MLTRVSVLALLTALATPLVPTVGLAQSACSPSAPSDGDAVTCSGSGPGVEDGGLDDSTITVTGTGNIFGGDRGLRFDDDVTVTVEAGGSVTGSNDHAIQGDNGVSVTNNGTITGLGGDGVNIDNDGILVNNGTITSDDDDGVQLEDDPQVTNNGTITAVDEGINVNNDNAQVTNSGTVTAVDDGINAANNAMIVNSGTVTATGTGDAIDFDSGTVTNTATGILQAQGGEDGIDIDETRTGATTITNSGTVTGNLGINTAIRDDNNALLVSTQPIHVINSGSITGTGGTAIQLGHGDDSVTDTGGTILGDILTGDPMRADGMDTVSLTGTQMTGSIDTGSEDDTVLLDGATVSGNLQTGDGNDTATLKNGAVVGGSIDMGAGSDTLNLALGSEATSLSWSNVETVNLSAAANLAIVQGATGFATVDRSALAAPDVLSGALAFGATNAVFGAMGAGSGSGSGSGSGTVSTQGRASGIWLTTYVGAGSMGDSDKIAGASYDNRGAVLGYDLGRAGLSAFLAYGQGESTQDNGTFENRIRSYMLGLAHSGAFGGFSYDVAGFVGTSHNATSNLTGNTGEADYDGTLAGLSLRGTAALMRGAGGATTLDYVVGADVVQHTTESHTLSGLGGATVEERSGITSALSLEIGAPMDAGGLEIRPYIGVTAERGNGDDVTVSAFGGTTSFDASSAADRNVLSLGMTFAGAGVEGRVEATRDDNDGRSLGAMMTLRF